MGLSLLRLAVKGSTPEHVNDVLGLRATDDYTALGDEDYCSKFTSNGVYQVWLNAREFSAPLNEAVIAAICQEGELIRQFLDETTMMSFTDRWRRGAFVWSLSHDGCEDPWDLEACGPVPEEASTLLTKYISMQRDDRVVDWFFEIPKDLFLLEGGFAIDQHGPPWDEDWQVLEFVRHPKRVAPLITDELEHRSLTASMRPNEPSVESTQKRRWWWPFS